MLNAQSIGLIGSFNNWSSDEVMNNVDGENFTLNYTFSANEQVQFRQDGSWTINWGGSTFPWNRLSDGPNIMFLRVHMILALIFKQVLIFLNLRIRE